LPEPGLDGIAPERAVYPLTFHDARSVNSDRLTTFFEAKWVFGSGRMADFQVLVLFFWIYGDLWLVVSNMFYIFFHHIWEWKIIPTDEFHHFSEGLKQTTNQPLEFRHVWAKQGIFSVLEDGAAH
jgi:hypothetical protein